MDDLVTQLRTQKLTAGDVLSSAVDIYKDNFGAYLRIILLLLIPLSLLSIYVGESLLQFPIAFASLLPQIGIIALTHRAIYGSVPDSTEASFSSLLTLVFAAAVTTFLTGIVIGIGAIFLIIPGIIAGIRLSFVLHALVLRGQNSIDSLSYSNEVAKAHGWHILRRSVFCWVGHRYPSMDSRLPDRAIRRNFDAISYCVNGHCVHDSVLEFEPDAYGRRERQS